MKECSNCGTMNEEEVIFCATCGHNYPDSDKAATEDTTPRELASLSGEKLIVPIKEVLCPHCSFHVEINLAHRYQCPNCQRFFSHSKSFFYRCDVCATPVIIHATSNSISCSVCTQKYRFDVKNITLANPLAELTTPEQKEPVKLSFGFIFLLGFGILVISLLLYTVINANNNAIMTSQLFNNFTTLLIASIILWIVVSVAIVFFVLEHTLIATEGMVILAIDLLLAIYTIFFNSNQEFSSLLPFWLIVLYIASLVLRSFLYIFSPASGQAATNDWFFWLCMCDSTSECILPCLTTCDCSCGDCDCGDCDCNV